MARRLSRADMARRCGAVAPLWPRRGADGSDWACRRGRCCMTEQFDDRKARASGWFRELRDRIVAAFEALEDAQATGPCADRAPGRFDVSETRRKAEDGGD